MANEGEVDNDGEVFADTFYLSIVHPLVMHHMYMERLICVERGTDKPCINEEYVGEIVMHIMELYLSDTSLLDFTDPPEVLLTIMQRMDRDYFEVHHRFSTEGQ